MLFPQTLKKKRSYCPNCKRTLRWYELVPVLSYVAQSGKCRNCKESISVLYPLVELATGLGWALSYRHSAGLWEFLFSVSLVSCCMILFVTDSYYQIIPNKVLLSFLPIFIGWRIFFPVYTLTNHLLGALSASLLLAVIIVASKGGMGMGDLKFFTLLGWLFGWQQFLLLFLLATGYGTIYSLILVLRKKANRQSRIPFGPFISLAALTVLFYGAQIIQWYSGLFSI